MCLYLHVYIYMYIYIYIYGRYMLDTPTMLPFQGPPLPHVQAMTSPRRRRPRRRRGGWRAATRRRRSCRWHLGDGVPWREMEPGNINNSWWFGCHQFYFPILIGFLIIPIDFHIFQQCGPTTNQSSTAGGCSIFWKGRTLAFLVSTWLAENWTKWWLKSYEVHDFPLMIGV